MKYRQCFFHTSKSFSSKPVVHWLSSLKDCDWLSNSGFQVTAMYGKAVSMLQKQNVNILSSSIMLVFIDFIINVC